MTVEAHYKDEVITYDEDSNKWGWDGRSYATLTGAKRAIDRRDTTDFTRVPCLVRRWGRWYVGEITSMTDDGGCWVTAANAAGQPERRRERVRELYMDTPENWVIVKKAEGLMKEADNLHREANELLDTLTPVFFPAE